MDFDPFANEAMLNQVEANKIHVRMQSLGNKKITTVDGLAEDLDLKRIARAMKKSFHCAVKVIETEEEQVIQLQGDHREVIKEWLIENEVITKDTVVVVHGG